MVRHNAKAELDSKLKLFNEKGESSEVAVTYDLSEETKKAPYKDAVKATEEGVKNAIIARDKNAAYRAANGILTPAARLDDALRGIGKWDGISTSAEGLKKTLDVYQKGFDFKKQLEDLALKKSTQAKVYDQQIDIRH